MSLFGDAESSDGHCLDDALAPGGAGWRLRWAQRLPFIQGRTCWWGKGQWWSRGLSWPPSLSADHSLPWSRTPLVYEDNLTRAFLVPWAYRFEISSRANTVHPSRCKPGSGGTRGWALEGQSWLRCRPVQVLRGLCHQTSLGPDPRSPCTRLGGYFPSLSLSFLSGQMGIKTRLTLEGRRFNTVMCEVLPNT